MHSPTSSPVRFSSLVALGAELASRAYAHRGVPASSDVIRVLVVDDHALVRAGVVAILSTAPDMVVVGEAANGADAVTLASRLRPAVVVLDVEMPGGDGATATRALTALPQPPRVLILTMHDERELLLPLLDAGAAGYLAKDTSRRELLDAIRVVATGDTYVRPAVSRRLAVREDPPPVATRSARELYDSLSGREQTVLRLTAQGLSGPEVARKLAISPKTVNTYKQRIQEKTGLENRVAYVRFAIEARLLNG